MAFKKDHEPWSMKSVGLELTGVVLTLMSRTRIGELCRLHGVRKLEVFGSILRRDFDPP